MGYLDKQGLQRVWDKIKSLFASSLSFSNRTLTLKNKNGDTLSTVELPYRGIYFVKGTQTAATGAWKGALPEVESLYDGLTIAYFLPYNGSGEATLTLTLKNSTTKAEPVYYNNSSRATTHYGAGATVVLTWISNATSGYSAVGTATGRWTRADYNANTYTSAVCTTAAGNAAKTATCTDYALLKDSYVHVLIKNSNTIQSALTLSINGKTAKPIYINGTASSATNYTLSAGTYIVFYDGTNYYFNTNGNLPGHIDGSSITGDISTDNLDVDLYNKSFRAIRILAWPSAVSTGGWKRLCLIRGYNAYAVGKILINGGYSYGRPINAQCEFYCNYDKAGIKQTSGITHGTNSTILALRLVYNGSSKWWLDVKMNAKSGGAMSDQYVTLIGAFSVTDITENNTFLTDEPTTTTALCELRTIVDTPTISVDLASAVAGFFTGEDMTTGVTGILPISKGGTGKNTLDSGKALIGNGTDPVTLRDIYTRTDQGSLEWSSATNEYLVTKGALAYWNGAYGTGGTSNIKKLGTIDTGVWQGTKIGVAYGGTGITSNPSMLVNLASTAADTVFEASPRPGVTGTLGVGNGGTGLTSSPSMLVKLDATTADTILKASPRPGITGTLGVANGGTGQTSAKNASNAFINALDTETTALQDGDYFIAQTAGGGTTTTTYKRKALSLLSDYIEDKVGGNYLPLAGGQMTGPLTWKNGTALPAKTSDINYLLTIDSFSDGGTTKYATIANVANAIAPTVETAIENDYTFLTKKTDWEIPEEADLNTYTTPGIYICRNKTRATSLSNSPCKRGFSLIVLANLLDDNDSSISGVIQIVRMFTSHANSLPNQPVYTWQRKWYSNTWSDWVCTSGTMAPMSPGMGTDTTVQFTDINFEAAKYGLGSMFHFSSVNGTTTVGNPRASANILQMNYVAATGYDTQLALGQQGKWLSFRGQYQGRWSAWNYVQTLNFGTCTTAAATAAKTVTLNSHVSATTGTEITILFTNGNQATEPKLTINLPNTTDSAGTTYTGGTCGSNVAIYYQGKPVEPGYIKPGDVVRMIYYSSKWHIVGCINSVTSYGNHVLYHIKCDSGNDDNDGLTESTAFKTLDKFFEVTANSGYTDCRCRLDQAGDYFLNKQAANNITWHCRIGPSVTSTSVPVRIVGNYGVEESWIMYNSHIKLSGRYPKDYKSTDTANIPLYYVGYDPGTLQGIYFENCAVTLENVIFNCTVRTFGCYVNATKGLTAYRLYLYGSDGIVEDLEIEATSNGTNPAIQVWRGSSIRFSSPNSNNTLGNSNKEFGVKSLSAAATDPKNIFLDIRDSSVVLASKMPQGLTNPYYFGIKCVNAELTGKRAVLGTFQTGCVAGQIAADEETELNVSWGEPAFNSIYGVESVQITTPENTVQIPANAIKTWTIEKATIQTAIKAAHSYSTFPYQILAIIPSFTSDNRVIIKNALEDTSTGNVTVIGRNVSSSAVDVGATATVNILYTLKPLNIIKQS